MGSQARSMPKVSAGRPAEAGRTVLGNWRLRLLTVGLPALLAGSFEFVRPGLQAFAGLPEDLGNLITAALALLGALVYFHTLSSLVARLTAEADRARMEKVVFAEREALADELHDNLSQTFFFLNVRLKAVLDQLRKGSPEDARPLATEVAEITGTTEEVFLQLRDTIQRLHQAGGPSAPGTAGVQTLDRLVASALADSDLRVTVETDGSPPRLEPWRWAAAQSILLEALRNVRRHAAANRVTVWLNQGPGGGAAGVQDDGRGFEAGGATGFGLASMRRRAGVAALDLRIESRPGCGTRVELSLIHI